MNISANWLRNYLKTDLNNSELAAILTDIGLEVEALEKTEAVPGGLEGIVIGEVLEKEKHPDADRLSVTKVNVGSEILQIVCGASNVAAGQKVVVALPGSKLYPKNGEPFKIKKSKIRGIESNGMICAEDEIGLGESHDGIMVLDANAKVGSAASDYFQLTSDTVFVIGLTPNRIDAASHYGVARDLYAALIARGYKAELIPFDVASFTEVNSKPTINVEVEDTTNCLRYCGLTLSNIEVKASPEWIQNALRTVGLRPINNVVDIGNFVMLEMGQPLHAFDLEKITGNRILVRKAKAKTKFVTLDEVERELNEEHLMICNAQEEMCIAGIFGGLKSGVIESTTQVFLEAAYFNPTSIRKTARQLGLNTDSSFRFERGTDPELPPLAIKRAAQLLVEYANATITSSISDWYPKSIEPFKVSFNLERCTRLIGQELPVDEVEKILALLSIQILEKNNSTYSLLVPAYRVDVTREADVIEEILRIYGYNRITIPTKINASIQASVKPNVDQIQNRISDYLSANGYFETLNNSLSNSAYAEFGEGKTINKQWNVELLNPISNELTVLRQSLLFSGLEAIRYNTNRQQHNLKFYEFGKVYFKFNEKFEEQVHLSILLSGDRHGENWSEKTAPTSYYELKSTVEFILMKLGLFDFVQSKSTDSELLSDGLSYSIGKAKLVDFGPVKPEIVNKLDVKQAVFYADFNWNNVIANLNRNKIKYQEISKFPSVRRDLSLLINREVTFDDIKLATTKVDKKLIREIGLFDVYEGKNLEAGKKSYAISILLQDEEQTLTDARIEQVMKQVIESLTTNLGAQLR